MNYFYQNSSFLLTVAKQNLIFFLSGQTYGLHYVFVHRNKYMINLNLLEWKISITSNISKRFFYYYYNYPYHCYDVTITITYLLVILLLVTFIILLVKFLFIFLLFSSLMPYVFKESRKWKIYLFWVVFSGILFIFKLYIFSWMTTFSFWPCYIRYAFLIIDVFLSLICTYYYIISFKTYSPEHHGKHW